MPSVFKQPVWVHRWSSKKGRWNGRVVSSKLMLSLCCRQVKLEVGIIALWFQKVIAASKAPLFFFFFFYKINLVSDLFTEAWNTCCHPVCSEPLKGRVHGVYYVIHTGEVMVDLLYLQVLLGISGCVFGIEFWDWENYYNYCQLWHQKWAENRHLAIKTT